MNIYMCACECDDCPVRDESIPVEEYQELINFNPGGPLDPRFRIIRKEHLNNFKSPEILKETDNAYLVKIDLFD